MKKKILLVFVLLLSVVTLAACNKSVKELVNETLDVIVSGDGLTKDMEVVVDIIDDKVEKAKDFIGKLFEEAYDKGKEGKVYNIELTDKGIKRQPDGEVEVKLPKLEGVSRHKVFHETEDGDTEELECEEDGDYVKFKTRKFSLFALCAADGTDLFINATKGGVLMVSENGKSIYEREGTETHAVSLTDDIHLEVLVYAGQGYRFKEWRVSGSKDDAGIKLSNERYLDLQLGVLKDETKPFIELEFSIYITAVFEAYDVEFLALAHTLEGGDILVNGEIADTGNGYSKTVKIDDKVTLKARPKENYEFLGWYEDAEGINLISTNLEETFTIGAENVYVYAHFSAKVDNLQFDAANAGFVDGVATYRGGDVYIRPDLVLILANLKNGNERYLARHEYNINYGGLDFSKPGTYTITYTYKRDTTVSATLTVIVV